MKKITQKEFDNLKLLYKGKSNPFFREFANLEIGEHLVISRKEWKLKTNPIHLVACAINNKNSFLHNRGIKMSGRTFDDNSGWVFTRIK